MLRIARFGAAESHPESHVQASSAGVADPTPRAAQTRPTLRTAPSPSRFGCLGGSISSTCLADASCKPVTGPRRSRILAGAGITNTGPTTIKGDVGTFPTTTETGFGSVTLNGTNHHGDAVTQGAKTDLSTAYNTAAGSGPTIPVVADLGGQTLTPAVYNSASSLGLIGTLTLSGTSSDVWIFQAGSTLTTASGSSVVFDGGATSCNVSWQISSSATIGTDSEFKGTIMALTSITVTTGATIDGRALARNGAVTLDTNTITNSCSTAAGASPTSAASSTPAPASSQLPDAAMSRGEQPVAPWSPPVVIGAVAAVLMLVLIVINRRRAT